MIGLGIVDILVVVAVGAVAMGGDCGLGGRPEHGPVGLHPDGHAALGRRLELLQCEAAASPRRTFSLMRDDVLPIAGVGWIAERMQVLDHEIRNAWLAGLSR